MIAFNLIKKALFPQPIPVDKFSKFEVKPYMKTPDVVAMDINSFLSSKEVKNQYYLAGKFAEGLSNGR